MAKASTKSLKAALKSQQSRFKAKDKQAHALQAAEQKGKRKSRKGAQASKNHANPELNDKSVDRKGKGKATPSTTTRKVTIPFLPTDTILLVGEGNFSYAHALVHDPPRELEHLPPNNVTATAYDTEVDCYSKYPEAEAIVCRLREKGVHVLFGVDATRLDRCAPLKGKNFDKIVWNFPHAGKGITDQDRNILSNQLLVLGFLRSASKALVNGPPPAILSKKKRSSDDDDDDDDSSLPVNSSEGGVDIQMKTRSRGSVLITLRNVSPYTLWDIPRLAKNPPPPQGSTPPNPHYIILRSFVFNRSSWKGYEHRMTKGERAHGAGTTGTGGEDRTWEFCLRD
ncbi:hypothetical protein ONZ45_g7159 [Pleurotus djamor]|nr:hypothetical protein ONZ45_g7159 [Pleurotus djamor]